MPREQDLGALTPFEQGDRARDLVGIEAVEVPAGREHRRGPDQIPTRCRRHVPRVECAQQPGHFLIFGEESIDRLEVDRRRPLGERFTDRLDGVAPRRLGHPLPDNMQPKGDEGVLQLEELRTDRIDLVGRGTGPQRLACGELEHRRLFLDQCHQIGIFLAGRAVLLQARLERGKILVEPRVGDRRGEIADEGRPATPLGQRPLGGVVGGVEIDVRQIADEALRPAGVRQPDLLPRHELERPMRPEVQHGIGTEILTQPAIEGGEGVRRREVSLEEEPHRVPFPPERRLHTDEHVPEALPHHEELTTIGQLLAGRRPPDLLEFA